MEAKRSLLNFFGPLDGEEARQALATSGGQAVRESVSREAALTRMCMSEVWEVPLWSMRRENHAETTMKTAPQQDAVYVQLFLLAARPLGQLAYVCCSHTQSVALPGTLCDTWLRRVLSRCLQRRCMARDGQQLPRASVPCTRKPVAEGAAACGELASTCTGFEGGVQAHESCASWRSPTHQQEGEVVCAGGRGAVLRQ